MKSRHGYVLLLASGIFLSLLSLCEGAPLLYPHKSGETADWKLIRSQATICLLTTALGYLTAKLADAHVG